jgi:hypothetical protein
MLKDLYYPSGTSLHHIVSGQSGSGKSFFLEATSKEFLRQNQDPNYRMVYFSPKNENYTNLLGKKQKPVGSVDDMVKSMNENILTVFYPQIEGLEDTMDDVINSLFDMRDMNPDLRQTLIIDDAQVFLKSTKTASDAHRRLALLGRSRFINVIYVSHGMILNKTLEGQVESLHFFSMPSPLAFKDSIKRFGFDPEPFVKPLADREYSFVRYSIKTQKATLMSPIGE